jgi:nitrite reductase (NO-forming)
MRIAFGVLWTIDAVFKWLPGFIHGQTLGDELGAGGKVRTPVIHQWILLWHAIGTSHPGAFAIATAVIESCIALGLLFGVFSNLVFVGSALWSFGIWSAGEAFHLPWTTPGMTDLGPSAAYWIASLALLFAAGGAMWSLDGWVRPRLGRLGFLAGRRAPNLKTVA